MSYGSDGSFNSITIKEILKQNLITIEILTSFPVYQHQYHEILLQMDYYQFLIGLSVIENRNDLIEFN